MKVEFTQFALRQFNTKFAGTKLPLTIDNKLGNLYITEYLNDKLPYLIFQESYQPFCKYLIIKNEFDQITSGTIKLNWFTRLFLKSGYSSRTPEELSVLSRWVKLPFWFKRPKAKYLVFVLYSREQLDKELKENQLSELSSNCEWGIVAVLGTSENKADPMPPITMMRNALGIEEGGNGAPLDKNLYNESIEFWSKYALIK